MYGDTHACLASYAHACMCMWRLEVDAGVSPDHTLSLLYVFVSASWFLFLPMIWFQPSRASLAFFFLL